MPDSPTALREHGRVTRIARGAGKIGIRILATVGTAAVVITAVGAGIDISRFDETQGGYEPPYENYTGTPIDWSQGAITRTGYLRPGIILDTILDCTTGMISFGVLGAQIDFRVVSERALAVHKPHEACAAAGFDPQFG